MFLLYRVWHFSKRQTKRVFFFLASFPTLAKKRGGFSRAARLLTYTLIIYGFDGFKRKCREVIDDPGDNYNAVSKRQNPLVGCNRPGYVIYAPDYRTNSAGTRCLYLLCDRLNKAGFESYVTWSNKTAGELIAPIIPIEVAKALVKEDFTAVYPEVISGNPLGAKNVARWVLNRPGVLGGDKIYHKSEQIFSYSKILNSSIKNKISGNLYLPTIDETLFFPGDLPAHQRTLECYYVGKSSWKPGYIDPGKAFEITSKSPERKDLGKIFRVTKVFFCFDNMTALVYEAIMCGCPVVLIPDGSLSRQDFDLYELSPRGIAWGLDELESARADVAFVKAQYRDVKRLSETQLMEFIAITQERARACQ